MGRGDPIYRSKAERLAARSTSAIPPELRGQLESTRLDVLALMRALDRSLLAQDLPAELGRLSELDADLAEALHVMDLPPRGIDFAAMVRDTMTALAAIPAARERFLARFDEPTRSGLMERAAAIRAAMNPQEAHFGIPGRGR